MAAVPWTDSSTLLAVVGASPAGRRSLDHVSAIGAGLGAPVLLAVVSSPRQPDDGIGWTMQRVAAYGAERLRRAGLPVQVAIVNAPAAGRVAALASAAGLVIVGREGDGDRLPEQIIKAVHAPVLVVRDGPAPKSPAYRILLGIRDPGDVGPDVEVVARLARAVEVEALVVHVPEIRSGPFGGYLEPESCRAVAVAVARLRDMGVKAQGSTVPPSLDPADTLDSIADEWDATLVVLNSSRPSGFLGWFTASTARALLRHGTRPVLLTAR